MCFVIHPSHPNAKTAKRDVVCYKTLRHDRTSVIKDKDFKYRIGKRYRLPGTFPTIVKFPTIVWWKPLEHQIIDRDLEIHEGYHSYSSKKMLRERVRRTRYCPFRCTIPAGSTYYFNPSRHEYVSDSITVNEQIKI